MKLTSIGNVTEPYFKGEKRAGPVEAIKCIINEFKDNPVTFKKGDWFMTGSVIQPFKVNKGDKLKDFRTLGKSTSILFNEGSQS